MPLRRPCPTALALPCETQDSAGPPLSVRATAHRLGRRQPRADRQESTASASHSMPWPETVCTPS
jgi:hypothetical protein